MLTGAFQGILRSVQSDIEGGRLGHLQLQNQAEVFADFVVAAKAAIDEDAKGPAAVLASVALEDMLKRFALAKGLEVEDEDMSTVIGALKSAGHLSGVEGKLLSGMVRMRNKALHAEWERVDETAVRAAIAFGEEFLLKRFG